MSRLTIVHVLTRLLKAGSEENTLHSCRAQVAAGHRVVLVHGREVEPAVAERARGVCEVTAVPSLVHPIAAAQDARAVADLRRLFARLQADVVHTHQSKAGVLGRLAARMAGTPLIVHGVHILPWVSVGPAQRAVYLGAERMCAGFTDAFISVSPAVRDACLSERIGPRDAHFVAFSAMDVGAFKASRPPPDAAEILGLAPGAPQPPTALMLAAFEPRKRQGQAIDAIGAAFAGLPDWRVVFAGEGPELEACRRLAAARGLADKVRFTGHRPDPERLIAMADVCFLTSEREGLPRVVVQYAAAGKPMVVTALPGLEDILTEPEAAEVAPRDAAPQAMAAVARLLADPAERARRGAAARRIDVDRWSPESMARSVEAAYEAGAARARRRAAA